MCSGQTLAAQGGPNSPMTVRYLGSVEALGKAASAYEQLKAFAINGQLKPGRRLAAQDIAEYFGTSVTPIRDALTRLAFEGFIGREASHGFYSKAFTVEEQRQLLWMGYILLTASIRSANGDLPARLLNTLASLKDVPGDPADLAQTLEVVHRDLAEASGNDVLAEVSRTMIERTHLVRRLDMQAPEAAGETIATLRVLGPALLAGEVDKAVGLIRDILDGRLRRLPMLVKEANFIAGEARFP